jgi:hypothetical protein
MQTTDLGKGAQIVLALPIAVSAQLGEAHTAAHVASCITAQSRVAEGFIVVNRCSRPAHCTVLCNWMGEKWSVLVHAWDLLAKA